ncbi:hypothetical protein OSB04_029934 [Centaurea solstitialis]|uniref:RING-type domain-containing protein n=1 Tax=Centaurea solstitialis TaxID=347529 RepID=A0AA38W6N0_9ASTR|nr:hypothetical protein OSB04_029934 [Centaurea solstitialis]
MPSERKVRTRVLASMLTCKICKKLIKDSTAIADCLHSFCEKCIYKKVYEEKCHNCPVCNVEINGSLLRPDATMRSLKVSLLGVHRRTPEQRAESKRMKLEKMKASHDQAKKPESTKKLMIAQKDKGKGIVIDKPLEDQRITPESTKKLVIAQKDKGKGIVIDKPLEDQRITPESTKKLVIAQKDKGKGIVIDKPLEDQRITTQSTKKPVITHKEKGKGIVIDKPLENKRISVS